MCCLSYKDRFLMRHHLLRERCLVSGAVDAQCRYDSMGKSKSKTHEVMKQCFGWRWQWHIFCLCVCFFLVYAMGSEIRTRSVVVNGKRHKLQIAITMVFSAYRFGIAEREMLLNWVKLSRFCNCFLYDCCMTAFVWQYSKDNCIFGWFSVNSIMTEKNNRI